MKMTLQEFRYLHNTLQSNMPAELWSRKDKLVITSNASGYAGARLIREWPGLPMSNQALASDLSRHGIEVESLADEYWRLHSDQPK